MNQAGWRPRRPRRPSREQQRAIAAEVDEKLVEIGGVLMSRDTLPWWEVDEATQLGLFEEEGRWQ